MQRNAAEVIIKGIKARQKINQKIRKRGDRPIAGFSTGYSKIVVVQKSRQIVAQIVYVLIFNDDGIIIKDETVGQGIIVERQTDDDQHGAVQPFAAGKAGYDRAGLAGSTRGRRFFWGDSLLCAYHEMPNRSTAIIATNYNVAANRCKKHQNQN